MRLQSDMLRYISYIERDKDRVYSCVVSVKNSKIHHHRVGCCRNHPSLVHASTSHVPPRPAASTNPWPEAASSKLEYFRVAFDARLRWVDGDASKAPRQRGGFGGDFARRPRPAPAPASVPPRETSPAAGAGSTGEGSGGAGGVYLGGALASTAAGGMGGPAREASNEELLERAGPATVFCDTEIKVQVLLPPPYNTLLPWRLVRALLGKLLSTIVAYVLPRFLEVRVCVCGDDTGGCERALVGVTAVENVFR